MDGWVVVVVKEVAQGKGLWGQDADLRLHS